MRAAIIFGVAIGVMPWLGPRPLFVRTAYAGPPTTAVSEVATYTNDADTVPLRIIVSGLQDAVIKAGVPRATVTAFRGRDRLSTSVNSLTASCKGRRAAWLGRG